MRRWNPNLRIAPKDFRNALITDAKLNGYDSSLLEQYVGHAPRSVSDTNYLPRLTTLKTHSRGEQDALRRLRDIFSRAVLVHVERAVREYDDAQQRGQNRIKIASNEKSGDSEETPDAA